MGFKNMCNNIEDYIGGNTIAKKFPELLDIAIDFVSQQYNDKVEDIGYNPEIPETESEKLICKLIQFLVIGLYWQPLMAIDTNFNGEKRAIKISENLPLFLDRIAEFNIKFSMVISGEWEELKKDCQCPICLFINKCSNTIEIKKIQKYMRERYGESRNL
jgi:hypothetical protein